MSINYYARCAALRASPINPKENKKKKRQKKRKKKAIISRVLGLVCKVFGKKILPLLFNQIKQQIKRVWRFILQNTF
jgi:hypothetical protein